MKATPNRFAVLAMVAAALALTGGPSLAQTGAEAACRSAIAKSLTKFTSIAFKDHSGCHKKRSAGKYPLETKCNEVLATPGNKTGAAYESASAAILEACPETLTAVLGEYARCPSPHSTLDDDGATSGIDDFVELSDCLLNLVQTLSDGASATLLGRPDALPTKGAAKCQGAIGKAVGKIVGTIGKVRQGCQSKLDKALGGVSYDCATFDDGKIAKTIGKIEANIAKSCQLPQDEVAVLGACGQTPGQLSECVSRIARGLGGGIIGSAYELPGTCKVGHVSIDIHAGNGERNTATRFDVGFNGFGHEVDLLDGFEGAVDLSCDDDCLNCAVTIAPVKAEGKGFCRCDANPTVRCDTISGPDADDCGGGNCTCMFGPPLPLSAASTPTCVVNKLVEEIDGVADAGSGVSTTKIHNTAVVYLGISQLQPCPICVGDPSRNDGVRGGLCSGGARDGQSCDRNGYSSDFGILSYDCPPLVGSNISGSGLKVEFDLTSVVAPSLTTGLTDGTTPVFCLQCSGDTSIGCSSDAECAAAGAGNCTANTGVAAKANGCSDGVCTAADTWEPGVCVNTDPDKFCDGLLRTSGRGLLACTVDGDCAALDSICPAGSCGDCSIKQLRSCFTDPFNAIGTHGALGSTEVSGVYGANLAATFCVAPTGNLSVNSSVGLPGPGRLQIEFAFDARCASDKSVRYEAPGGSSCP